MAMMALEEGQAAEEEEVPMIRGLCVYVEERRLSTNLVSNQLWIGQRSLWVSRRWHGRLSQLWCQH